MSFVDLSYNFIFFGKTAFLYGFANINIPLLNESSVPLKYINFIIYDTSKNISLINTSIYNHYSSPKFKNVNSGNNSYIINSGSIESSNNSGNIYIQFNNCIHELTSYISPSINHSDLFLRFSYSYDNINNLTISTNVYNSYSPYLLFDTFSLTSINDISFNGFTDIYNKNFLSILNLNIISNIPSFYDGNYGLFITYNSNPYEIIFLNDFYIDSDGNIAIDVSYSFSFRSVHDYLDISTLTIQLCAFNKNNNSMYLTSSYTWYKYPSVSCLTENTTVLTPNGYIKIDNLKNNDLIITSDNRIVPIIKFIKFYAQPNKNNNPYLIPSNSISSNYPPNDVIISGKHLIKFNNGWIQPRYGFNKKLFIQLNYTSPILYFHIILPNFFTDFIVINNGCVVESFGNNLPIKLKKINNLYYFS